MKPSNPRNTPARAARPVHPALHRLAELYPQLFGATFEPLKRGIFQDLMAAHPGVFERDALKAALAQHTRGTRYLTALAEGRPRRALDGTVAEPTAPEHVHLALVEVVKRRQARSKDDLRAHLSQRIVRALDASGLSPTEYAEKMQSQDPWAQAALDDAMAFARDRAARAVALQRAFATSGQSVEDFAASYGMGVAQVSALLKHGANPQTP